MFKNRAKFISLFILLILLFALPFLYTASQTIQQLLTRATGTPADILVNTARTLEPIQPVWNAFSQGGEEPKDMIAPVVAETKVLKPSYIRIDHLYDHHPIVSRNSTGQLQFNFAELDGIVKSITATGALPFFSLSYMPQAIASGDITSVPKDWNEWALVVQKTVERYSGKDGFNLTDIYYEVWNEPDLFGKWKYAGEKNYLTLYTYAAQGAARARNTNAFKIGGPATTQLYRNWIVALANHVTQNKLRLDFLSWHRYNTNPSQYSADVAEVTRWLFPYPALVTLPRIISEWGFDSDLHRGYDGALAAAHTVATARQTLSGYKLMFAFEVVDGLDPSGKRYWGRWGLLTHPRQGKVIKPRYHAFNLLNQLEGQRLLITGEGTWVSAIAAKTTDTIKILLVNYDYSGRHTEEVPLTITSLIDGTYTLKTTRLGTPATSSEITVSNGKFTTTVIMTPNAVTFIELTPPKNPFLGN